MAAPVRIRLRFWPPGDARRPLLPLDQVVRVYAEITDEAGLPVAAEGVEFFFRRPDGTVLTVSGADVVSPEVGVCYAEMLGDQVGDWAVEVTCTGPRRGASLPDAGFRVQGAVARAPSANAPLWVDQDGRALTEPGGGIVNTLRADRTPETSDPTGGRLLLIQDDQVRNVAWETLQGKAAEAGAAVGQEAGASAGAAAGSAAAAPFAAAAAESAAAANFRPATVDAPGDYALTDADNGKIIRFVGAAAHKLTLPAGLQVGTQILAERAPGCGPVSLLGLTVGVSHIYDHASIDVMGQVLLQLRPGVAGVNGGAPYWSLTGLTAP